MLRVLNATGLIWDLRAPPLGPFVRRCARPSFREAAPDELAAGDSPPQPEWLYGGALDARDDILGFYRACEEQGGLVKTHIWRLPLYVVTAPELIEEVLIRKQRCFIKSGALRSTSSPSVRACSRPTTTSGFTSGRPSSPPSTPAL